jgi:hypothetical protein
VFTARYAQIPYTTQARFAFERLTYQCQQHNCTSERSSTKSVKMQKGHHYPCFGETLSESWRKNAPADYANM